MSHREYLTKIIDPVKNYTRILLNDEGGKTQEGGVELCFEN
jgi:hypothetical protein